MLAAQCSKVVDLKGLSSSIVSLLAQHMKSGDIAEGKCAVVRPKKATIPKKDLEPADPEPELVAKKYQEEAGKALTWVWVATPRERTMFRCGVYSLGMFVTLELIMRVAFWGR
jgi:hypothetical protein